ncbi:MAG: hypothetical protein GWP06_06795 [Actinobacteria bacterium]|nr:hypothetical protein [Actinomycetota bacterium]
MNTQSNNSNSTMQQVLTLMNSKPQIDLKKYLRLLWRRKWIIILTTLLITTGSIVYALWKIRPIYQVSATVAIESSRPFSRSIKAMTSGFETYVDRKRLSRKIFSIENLSQLVDRMDLTKVKWVSKSVASYKKSAPWLTDEEAEKRASLAYLHKKLDVKVSGSGDQFQVSVQDFSPAMAYHLVKNMTLIFVKESKKNDLRGIQGVKQFSDEQLALYKRKMDASERRLKKFHEKLATQKMDNVGISEGSILKLKGVKNSTLSAIAQREQKLAELERGLPGESLRLFQSHGGEMASIKSQVDIEISKFKRQIQNDGWQISAEMQSNNDLNVLRQQSHNNLAKAINKAFPDFNDAQRAALLEYQLGKLDLYILRGRVKVLDQLMDNYLQSVKDVPSENLELKKLEDEYNQNRRTYNLFLDQLRGSQIEEAIRNNDADVKYQIIQPAEMPIYAVGGSKKKFVILAFLASLMLGFGIVVVLEFLDQSIRSEEDAEFYLNLPVCGTIPKMNIKFKDQYAAILKENGIARTPVTKNIKIAEIKKLDKQNKFSGVPDIFSY